MKGATNNTDYGGSRAILAVIGILLLFVGVVSAFFGPAEMYCFYLFSEGGRFDYTGFEFGTFMFGNIASQITSNIFGGSDLEDVKAKDLGAARFVGPFWFDDSFFDSSVV